MDDLVDDLARVARRCERASRTLKDDAITAVRERVQGQVKAGHRAWSGSWIGHHARIYIKDFDPPEPNDIFDSEWGTASEWSTTRGRWVIVDQDEAKKDLLRRAGVSAKDLKLVEETAARARSVFDEARGELLPTLDAVLATEKDSVITGIRDEIKKLRSHHTEHEIVEVFAPKQFATRDSAALSEGRKVPPHLELEATILSQLTSGAQLDALGKHARYLVTYLQKRMKMTGESVAKTDGKIFIGHGGSQAWRDLKDFIQDRLKLTPDDFNREPTAGLSTKERLETMLDEAVFAFLVMTAEDERADGKKVARANVIHEVGLFQGRLGFERAIVLLEDGCEEFSNIVGLTQIRFPAGKVSAQFEEIRRVLEREKILR